MYRHFIAPPRAFTQFSHDLIRHPRLPSDTVRSLTWQLSLPEGARESLSRTAERARTGACAFTRAKRQLKEEGFVHERRVQGPGGHWVTRQFVCNTPLSAAEAAELLARTSVGAPSTPVSPQVAPRPRVPAVGDPPPSPTGGRPRKDPGRTPPTVRPPSRTLPLPPRRRPGFPERPVPSSPPSPASPPSSTASPAACRTNSPASSPPGRRRTTPPPPSTCTSCAACPTTAPRSTAPAVSCATCSATSRRRPTPAACPEPRPRAPSPNLPAPSGRSGPLRLSSRLTALRECEGDHVQVT